MRSSEETAVVARYLARHNADIARGYLEDQGIRAFVIADDVHVPLQFTEGVRLVVMESERERAHAALTEAGLLPEDMAWDGYETDDEGEEEEASATPQELVMAAGGDGWIPPQTIAVSARRKNIVLATTVALLLVVLVFFVPWRVEPSDNLRWAPIYRSPIADNSVYQRLGGGAVQYESGEVAYGILVAQLVGILVVGWITMAVIERRTSRPGAEPSASPHPDDTTDP